MAPDWSKKCTLFTPDVFRVCVNTCFNETGVRFKLFNTFCMNSGRLIRNIMKAVRVAQFGGPEVLKVEENVPIPKPQDNQVLVKVYAAGINPVDTYIRSGTYAVKPALPYTPGNDVAGIVENIGKNVTTLKEGDRVFSMRTVTGGYAEFCLTEEQFTQPLDENLTFEQGAALGVPYYTAYRATVISGRARAGETILVHGASGAVGLACVQLAKNLGLTVLGTAGSKAGMDIVEENGCDFVFNHKSDNYTQQIMDATKGEGPDLIIEMLVLLYIVVTYTYHFQDATKGEGPDLIIEMLVLLCIVVTYTYHFQDATKGEGPDLIIEMLANVNLDKDLNMIKKKGRIVIVGNRGSIEINPRFTMAKECIVTGIILMNSTPDDWKEMNASIQTGMQKGWVKPHIGKEYSLNQSSAAHNDVINNTGTQGKLVIKL
ncbi:qor [Mytilus coruscus]|uniref:Qor n=1 Tax=Mytilus coruscus TaxID=42192 RepID=A0A6J8BN33_MYTCO|nr:qor [Mytilus coruscus]